MARRVLDEFEVSFGDVKLTIQRLSVSDSSSAHLPDRELATFEMEGEEVDEAGVLVPWADFVQWVKDADAFPSSTEKTPVSFGPVDAPEVGAIRKDARSTVGDLPADDLAPPSGASTDGGPADEG